MLSRSENEHRTDFGFRKIMLETIQQKFRVYLIVSSSDSNLHEK